ncbi:hypothetical protein EDD22DRAFT_933623 [Suillus occidentalis]|nr:hypothetical protein EDD22DRAFT_933623 [Suillus occidentalis]
MIVRFRRLDLHSTEIKMDGLMVQVMGVMFGVERIVVQRCVIIITARCCAGKAPRLCCECHAASCSALTYGSVAINSPISSAIHGTVGPEGRFGNPKNRAGRRARVGGSFVYEPPFSAAQYCEIRGYITNGFLCLLTIRFIFSYRYVLDVRITYLQRTWMMIAAVMLMAKTLLCGVVLYSLQ